jgi:hypothetical protein
LVDEVETAPARSLAEEQSLAIDSHKNSESASMIEEDLGPESPATDPQTGEIPTSAAKASAAGASLFHTPLLDDHFPKYRTDQRIAMQTDDDGAENERTCAEPVLPASVFHTPMNDVQEGLDPMQTKDDSPDMDVEIQAEKENLAEPVPMLAVAFAPSPRDTCAVKEPSENQNGDRPSIITEVPCEATDEGSLKTHLSCEKVFHEDTRTAASEWFTQPPEENESEGDDDTFVNYGTRPRGDSLSVSSPSVSSPTTMEMISYLNVLSVEHTKPGLLSQHSELPPVMTQPNFDNHSADGYQ